MTTLDLTLPMDARLPIYTEDEYSDPPFERVEWCSIEARGYRVSAVSMGSQTGTHIDAPAHFARGGATIEALPITELVGPYFLVDLPDRLDEDEAAALGRGFASEAILFLRAPEGRVARLSPAALAAFLRSPTRVWAVDGAIEVPGRPPLEFHRALAAAGVYLVEDLRREVARLAPPDGEMIALPLALVGTSGAPCRVIVRPRSR